MSNSASSGNTRQFRLRATFVEQGRLAYLSHLEVAHSLERCVRRANLPFAITQGFSPHMKIAFGAALPVGVGSICEIFDVTLTDYVSPRSALEALQKASVKDLLVTDCAYIEPRAQAASVAFPFSTYEVVFSEALANINVPEEIVVVKKRKEKVLRVSDYLVAPFEIENRLARFTLEAKPTGSLRPDVLCNHLQLEDSSSNPIQIESITRIAQNATLKEEK